MAFERKRYENIRAIEGDPIKHAEAVGLVGNHSPETRRAIGVWRWAGLYAQRNRILPLITRGRVMDFGGAAGPLGYGSEIVDYEADAKAPYDLAGQFDTIFTSHTLEHIPDVQNCVECLVDKLATGGSLIVYVPTVKAVHLRSENHKYHCQDFYLSKDTPAPQPGWTSLEVLIGFRLKLEFCEQVDPTSALVIGVKQ